MSGWTPEDLEGVREWLKQFGHGEVPAVIALAGVVRGLLLRIEALENAALPPEKPAKKAKTDD